MGKRRGGESVRLVLAAVLALLTTEPLAWAQERAPSAEREPAVQRLVFALYHYSYQGDPRKTVATRDLRNEKGLCTLTDHPWESVGPWTSFDRAQWHRTQLQGMAASGIDVALALYRGDRSSRRGYAIKGLDVMTEALKELRAEGQAPARPREYPQIGMALDLGGLAEQLGGPADLRQPDTRRSLYGMIRDFYLHVPEEFRATLIVPASRPGPRTEVGTASTPQSAAYVVRLVGDGALGAADAGALPEINRRFAREFGAQILWVGTPGMKAKLPGLDATVPYPAALEPASVNSDGWIRTAGVGPGYDDSSQGPGGRIRPRENGRLTVADFRRIIEAAPDWIFVDSWNDYRRGTEIAPTLEHGLLYRDLVKGAIFQFKQSADWAADFLKASVPRTIEPNRVYQVDVSVQNSGTSDWDAFNVVALGYRWLKDGKPAGDQLFTASVSAAGHVRGESRTYLIGIAAPIHDCKALPTGEYEIEFNMTRRDGDETAWFAQEHTAPFRIPVTIGGTPASRPYWVSSTAPALARRGAEYPAQVRLRNDGADTWKKGTFSVGYRWRRVSTYLKGLAEDEDTVVTEGKRMALEADVEPGRTVTLSVPVTTTDAQGQPLRMWSPQDDWVYVLEWDLHDGQKYLGQAGGAVYREPVEVVDRDPAPHFLGSNLSGELVAGRTEKITVGLRNNGPEVWKKDRDKVIVHWYYLDGTEGSWNDAALPLPEDIPAFSQLEIQVPDDPTGRVVVGTEPPVDKKAKKGKTERKYHTETITRAAILREVPVRVPYYFGPMYCVLDFQHDGLNASTAPASKGTDILVIPVNVYSPTFTPLPVSAYFNVDGTSEDVARSDGNIDGRGNSLPSEFLPPYVNRPADQDGPSANPLYPSGLWVRPLNDLENSRVCFVYPGKSSGVPNMLRCEGQRLPFGGLPRNAVHVLAVCTEEDASGEFTLHYSDGSTEKRKVTFTHWNDAPKHGERAAFIAPHRHTSAGDDPGARCYLNHYTLEADRLKMLVGLELPRQPAVKIMAVTLESAGLRLN